MTNKEVINRVLALVGKDWHDLAFAAVKDRYGSIDEWIENEPHFFDNDFCVTEDYIMELMGVSQ